MGKKGREWHRIPFKALKPAEQRKRKKKMNMRKALPLFVIASMMVALIPSALVGAAVTISLSVSVGPVGTKVVVSGNIVTYNGHYQIAINANDDSDFTDPGEVLVASEQATGYAFSEEVTIPNAYAGARKIKVTDLDSSGPQFSEAFFTVQTKYKVETDASSYYQGGADPGGVVITATITGGKQIWAVSPGILDLRYRVKDPTGTVVLSQESLDLLEVTDAFGKFIGTTTIAPANIKLIKNGLYTVLLDWDGVTTPTWPSAQQGVASTTFNIYVTDKISYERTTKVYVKYYVPNGKTVNQMVLENPDGSTVTTTITPSAAGPEFTVILNPLNTAKDTALGTYRVKLKDSVTGETIVTQDFSVVIAKIKVSVVLPEDFKETYTLPSSGSANIVESNQAVERMHTVKVLWTVTYPDGITPVQPADLTGGFSVKVFYNTTAVETIALDPLTAYSGGKWLSSWKIPKDAVKGKNYMMNVTASTIVDQYGNSGPEDTYGTMDLTDSADKPLYFKVAAGTLYVTAGPTLNYPGKDATLARTLTSKVTFDVRYADDSRMTGAESKWVNVTATGGSTYTFNVPSTDYNVDVGLWIAKWKIPYNAPLGSVAYSIGIKDIEDSWGNKGPTTLEGPSDSFTVGVATITVSDVAVDKSSVQTDEQITVTFKATYPSGDPVTTYATAVPNYQWVDIIDSGGIPTKKTASYDSASQKWKLAYVIPTSSVGGTWNATVKPNYVKDDAGNTGPTAKKYVNFDVSRVSMTDVLAASNAAKAAADLASTKADAAKTAADTASTKADAAKAAADAALVAANSAKAAADAATAAATATGTTATSAKTAADGAKASADAAKTAADAAGTKADAATSAANAAKASADAAKAAAEGLTTMVYVAIAASVVAALAALFAVMQISKKIA